MNNIFENACFGKAYKTRDGRKAIYDCKRTLVKGWHWVLVEDEGMYQLNDNGLLQENEETRLDIVSEWLEEINEEDLDRLAMEYIKDKKEPSMRIASYNGFRAGFRARGCYCKAIK